MPTVIDALIVQLGLDPTEYKRGREQAENEFKKVKDQATKSNKEIKKSHSELEDSFQKLGAGALKFFAILAGTNSIKDFIQETNSANAALGRTAKLLNETPKRLYSMGAAAEHFGGSMEGAVSTVENLNQTFYEMIVNGKMPDAIARLSAMTGVSADFSHGVDGMTDSVAAMLQRMSQVNPSLVEGFRKSLGIDPGSAQAMIEYGRGYSQYLKELEKTAPSAQAIEAAQKLADKWATLNQNMGLFGSHLSEIVDGPLGKLVDELTGLVKTMDQFTQNPSLKNAQGVANYILPSETAEDRATRASRAQALAKQYGVSVDAEGNTTGESRSWFQKQIDSLFGKSGGARARGGPANAGMNYLVGEYGPEVLRMGSQGGSVIPNNALGGGLQVEGREVSKGNPVPVTITQQGDSGGGLWQWLFGGAGAGAGAASADGDSGGSGGLLSGVQQLASRTARAFGASGGKLAGNKGIGGWWTPDRIKHAVDYLQKNAGLSAEGAAGLVARWSGIESPGGPTSVNPSSGAFGIGQWLGGRLPGIRGNTDFDAQLAYAAKELNGSESDAAAVLRNAKTAAEGARGASMFERAEGYNAQTGRDNFTDRTPVSTILGVMSGKGTGGIGTGDPAAIAEGLLGMNREQVQTALKSKMTPGEWCADFVNGVLKTSGGTGINGSLAMVFKNWGQEVAKNDVKRNDVIIESHGGANGHVMIATGRRDANGRFEVISGNYSGAVKKSWENPDDIAAIRRGVSAGAGKSSMLFRPHGFSGGNVQAGASLSSITNNSPVTTSETSNSMHIGNIHVHAPKATDATGIASNISDALRREAMINQLNYGQA